MSCEFELSLTAFVDGELSPMEKRRLEVHLPSCHACRNVEAGLRRTVAQLSAMPAPSPSPELRRKVLAAVDALPPPGRAWWKVLTKPWILAPVGAVAFAASLVAISFTRMPDSPGIEFVDGTQLELAMQLTAAEELDREMLENFDLIGIESPEDLEVIALLHELEDGE